MDYIPRIADAALGEKLAYAKAVCIRGPRTSGRGSLRSAQGRALPALRERFFVDPSIAAAALEADEGTLLADLLSLGTLFESLCVRDLRVYAEALGGRLYRYHDNTGLEADAVMTVRDGRYALMEVKLGSTEIDDGARSLLTLADRIDQRVMGAPAFCAVITPGGYAYARNDGVLVLPITCLAP
jgi:predicted AAA+ superfamily ATPase